MTTYYYFLYAYNTVGNFLKITSLKYIGTNQDQFAIKNFLYSKIPIRKMSIYTEIKNYASLF